MLFQYYVMIFVRAITAMDIKYLHSTKFATIGSIMQLLSALEPCLLKYVSVSAK